MGRQLISPGLNLRFYNWVLFEIIIDGFRFICFHLNKSPNLSRHVQNLQNMVSTRHTSTYLCNIILKVACIYEAWRVLHKIEEKKFCMNCERNLVIWRLEEKWPCPNFLSFGHLFRDDTFDMQSDTRHQPLFKYLMGIETPQTRNT